MAGTPQTGTIRGAAIMSIPVVVDIDFGGKTVDAGLGECCKISMIGYIDKFETVRRGNVKVTLELRLPDYSAIRHIAVDDKSQEEQEASPKISGGRKKRKLFKPKTDTK